MRACIDHRHACRCCCCCYLDSFYFLSFLRLLAEYCCWCWFNGHNRMTMTSEKDNTGRVSVINDISITRCRSEGKRRISEKSLSTSDPLLNVKERHLPNSKCLRSSISDRAEQISLTSKVQFHVSLCFGGDRETVCFAWLWRNMSLVCMIAKPLI